ncbi:MULTISPECIES: type II secretion system F family protein [unclassified Janthinobacterium]|uniref:type II secretion system F family protein n=1 Tax=unclassified Janthinobacterium TaxID=2610881 RepID=UPI0025B1A8C1|nr:MULTISPECIES: type II secretion system F family protein [unclassified Janthinobacterium]MDN2717981.1 type II secretion system F family protein [Janthinobacterium sp. SUN120]MDO8070141.1 type II secretion system F family protein [Janthinobacterium sp. SUN176]MED5616222.1 type II secretion system F family protein [Janthinobacterium sp. P210005]
MLSYLVYLFLFLAVLLLVAGAWLAWQAARGAGAARVARRLQAMYTASDGEQALSITKQRPLSVHPLLHGVLEGLPGARRLDQLLLQAGMRWFVATFLGYCLLGGTAGLLLAGALPLPWYVRLGLAAGGAALPYLLVRRARSKRLVRIEQQLPDALDLMSRAMRAGHAFPTALKMVGEEMTGPLADEFRAVFDEVSFGVAMADALGNLAARVPSTDLRYFVIAVLIQRETGGNLTELLSSISAIIRDRLKLLGQVRVLSAEGRMSAWVLGLLPFGAALMMHLMNPQFIAVLYTDGGGRKMVGVSLGLLMLGVICIRRIINIRV